MLFPPKTAITPELKPSALSAVVVAGRKGVYVFEYVPSMLLTFPAQ